MSRPASGTVSYRPDPQRPGEKCWMARFTRADSTRTPWHRIPGDFGPDDEEGARKAALAYAPLARATTRDGAGESVTAYSLRWLGTRPPRAALDNGIHLRKHILPVVGSVPILSITSAHGDELVAALDRAIVAGTMSDATARSVWSTAKLMVKLAAHAKPATGLRCLQVDPWCDVMPPERSKLRRGKNYLYPQDVLDLFACRDVPGRWKRNVAIAAFLGLRYGEQKALRWEHVDLDRRVVRVCETYDVTLKDFRPGTKSGEARTIPIPATLLPLLSEMHERADGKGRVCPDLGSPAAMARGLRTWLGKAGVDRESLTVGTVVNLRLRWHDLRATTGTWLAVSGADPNRIRDILGHTKVAMTDRYTRNAEAMRGGAFGKPFPELPAIRHSFGNVGIDAANVVIFPDNSASNRRAYPIHSPAMTSKRGPRAIG